MSQRQPTIKYICNQSTGLTKVYTTSGQPVYSRAMTISSQGWQCSCGTPNDPAVEITLGGERVYSKFFCPCGQQKEFGDLNSAVSQINLSGASIVGQATKSRGFAQSSSGAVFKCPDCFGNILLTDELLNLLPNDDSTKIELPCQGKDRVAYGRIKERVREAIKLAEKRRNPLQP